MSTIGRRAFCAGGLTGMVAGGAAGGFAGWYLHHPHQPDAPVGPMVDPLVTVDSSQWGIPGPFPGRVIDVHHPHAVSEGKRNRDVVKEMIDRAMTELVGCKEPVDAWRRFFSAGDRVGIKVVPNGFPKAASSVEIVLEVIENLEKAGVRKNDILVFDRYKGEFLTAGYDKFLPDGVHWECSTADGATQIKLDGQPTGGLRKESKVSGYVEDFFRELSYSEPHFDLKDDRRFRSHVSSIVAQKVDKIVCIPVLKDHSAAGFTACLKNLSHGFVNNVARSHNTPWNTCGTFIPSIVSLPIIRQKAVLQIVDGLVGVYEGGPGPWNSTFSTWEANTLLVGTDPVAIDSVAWKAVDKQRVKEGWAPVARCGIDGVTGKGPRKTEQFQIRQPQYVPMAATAGLGIYDKIDIKEIRLGNQPA